MKLVALFLLIIAYFAFSSSRVICALRRFNHKRRHGAILIAMLAVPCLLATLPMVETLPGEFLIGLAQILVYLFLPGLLLLFRPARLKPLDVCDLMAIICLWLPLEFNWLPNATVPIWSNVNLPIPMLTGVLLGFLLFLVIRPLDQIGYTFKIKLADVLNSLQGLLVFLLAGLPVSIAIGFIHLELGPFNLSVWLLQLAAIYLLTAIPEELLFRGCIQNLLEQRFGRNWITLLIAAIIFGLAHLDNKTAYHVPPNWPYMVVATMAGLAYGWVWRQSNKITVSAVTHALVNFIWGVVCLK